MSTHTETSMLLGEYARNVGDEGQLVLPGQVATALGEELVVTRGFERNLILFSKSEFQALANRLQAEPISKPEARALRRRLFSAAAELRPDENGRIRLPENLREFAGIEGSVILAGMYQYAEIWSSDTWRPVIDAVTAISDDKYWDELGI